MTANTCGSIDATGLYTAPATIPTVTTSGTTTIAPAVTITATAQADTTKAATATLTIVTGISIAITPTTATVGTGEIFLFTATVNNPGCNLTSNPTCQNVTWSLSTTLTGIGTIGSTTGVYTAPATVPSPSTVIVTATSVADTSVTATATRHRGDRDDSHGDLGEPEHNGIGRALPGYLHHRNQFHFDGKCLCQRRAVGLHLCHGCVHVGDPSAHSGLHPGRAAAFQAVLSDRRVRAVRRRFKRARMRRSAK